MKKLLILLTVVSTVLACNIPLTPAPVTPKETQLVIPSATETFVPTGTPIVVSPTPSPTMEKGKYVIGAGDTLGHIAELFGIPLGYLADKNGITNPDLIFPGQVIIIPPWPPEPNTSEKEIIVVLDEQRLYAYEDGVLLRELIVSTGVKEYPTVRGEFEIYIKLESTRMTGPGYDLPNVPWTMYFYQGYGLHGTYWHNNFGTPMSHGCVNMRTEDAKWLFDWAEVGTKVWVI